MTPPRFIPAFIRNQASLLTVPDGTIISWLRIPTDETSAAVAFCRREDSTFWISPGGWDPMSIPAAGVTYPVEIIRWGKFDTPPAWPEQPSELLAPLIESRAETVMDLRKAALTAAALYWAGPVHSSEDKTLRTADAYEEWLDRPIPDDPCQHDPEGVYAASDVSMDDAEMELTEELKKLGVEQQEARSIAFVMSRRGWWRR